MYSVCLDRAVVVDQLLCASLGPQLRADSFLHHIHQRGSVGCGDDPELGRFCFCCLCLVPLDACNRFACTFLFLSAIATFLRRNPFCPNKRHLEWAMMGGTSANQSFKSSAKMTIEANVKGLRRKRNQLATNRKIGAQKRRKARINSQNEFNGRLAGAPSVLVFNVAVVGFLTRTFGSAYSRCASTETKRFSGKMYAVNFPP